MDGQITYKTADREDHEYDRRLIKQLINGLDDKVMGSEILREMTALEDNDNLCKCLHFSGIQAYTLPGKYFTKERNAGSFKKTHLC